MNNRTNRKKPIKKRSFAKGVQSFSTGTDSVNENQQLTTDSQTTLVETEEIKMNETQKLELEIFELQPNLTTETAADEKANLEVTSSELPPDAEPETPKEEEESTVELSKLETNESKAEQQPEESPLDDATESTESTVLVENATTASQQVEDDFWEQDDTLLDGAFAITPNTRTHRQMNAPLTVVNHKNGKRVKIGKEVCEKLQLADGDLVKFLFKKGAILICKALNKDGYLLSKNFLIYNKELVDKITATFQLNFDGRSSNSLTQVKYVKSQGQSLAVLEA